MTGMILPNPLLRLQYRRGDVETLIILRRTSLIPPIEPYHLMQVIHAGRVCTGDNDGDVFCGDPEDVFIRNTDLYILVRDIPL